MSVKSPFSYVSRTFQSLLDNINSDLDLKDKPVWWKRLWAGIGDWFSMVINAVANNLLLPTAYTRNAVKDLGALIDYDLSPHTTSSGYIIFDVDTTLGPAIFPFTAAEANLAALSEGSLQISSKRFEARADVTFTDVNDTFTTNFAVNNELTLTTDLEYTGHKVRLTTVTALPDPLQIDTDYFTIYVDATHVKLAATRADAYAGNEITLTDDGVAAHTIRLFSKAVQCWQQETIDTATIGTSDGITEWQEFDLADRLMLEATLSITINSIVWLKVDTLVDSLTTDEDYKVIPKSQNQFAVRFGNGTYGEIPGVFDIEADYAFGGGVDSNVTVLNKITGYAGSESRLTGVTNPTTFTGGSDEEGLSSAKRLAPLLLKARNRFVTVGDGEALVLSQFGVSLVKVLSNFYGPLSCKVLSILNGGGDADASLGVSIETYLIARSVLESIDVRHVASTITSTNVTSQVKILSGYAYLDVKPFVELAYKLFLSETGQEIQNKYVDDGIDATIGFINTIFTLTLDPDDPTTSQQVARLVDNLTPRAYGDTIQESDALGYIDSFVDGIDYVTITVFGAGFPIVNAADEITSNGVITITEIP